MIRRPLLMIVMVSIAAVSFLASGISRAEKQADNSLPGLWASVDKTSAAVGGTAVLTLTYRLPFGARIPADPSIEGLGDLTIVERVVGSGRVTITFLVDRLASWKSPPLSLHYVDKDGRSKTLSADPVSIEVLSNLGDNPSQARLRPIQGIIPTTPLWPAYVPWGAAVLATGLAIAGLVWFRRRRHTRKASPEPDVPPHVRAVRDIEELNAERLFEQGLVKAFYFRFSEILRRYLGSLRGFPALRLTAEEIAIQAQMPQDQEVLSLLRSADLVKFADLVPPAATKEDEVKRAISYVRDTAPPARPMDRTQGASA